jgi:hypothetical protein
MDFIKAIKPKPIVLRLTLHITEKTSCLFIVEGGFAKLTLPGETTFPDM